MSQQPSSERSHLRAVQGERATPQQPADIPNDTIPPEGATVQHIWDIVRKSTDVIVALREENSLLRNELAALRKSEHVLQDRLEDLLSRIDELEQGRKAVPSSASSRQPIDSTEDSLNVGLASPTPSSTRTTTITITIQDDARSSLERKVSSLVNSLVEELQRGI